MARLEFLSILSDNSLVMLQEKTAYYKRHPQDLNGESLKSNFRGFLWEIVCKEYLIEIYRDSPFSLFGETGILDFYQSLFPEATMIEFPFGKISLTNVSVPDEILLDGLTPIWLLEFTLQDSFFYFSRKRQQYSHQKKIAQKRGFHDLDQAEVCFVVPSNLWFLGEPKIVIPVKKGDFESFASQKYQGFLQM